MQQCHSPCVERHRFEEWLRRPALDDIVPTVELHCDALNSRYQLVYPAQLSDRTHWGMNIMRDVWVLSRIRDERRKRFRDNFMAYAWKTVAGHLLDRLGG